MKRISYLLLIAIALCSCSSLKPTLRGNFVDARDGHEYKWVKLGTQIWMAQNLDFTCSNSWYYNNDSTNHKIYGRFYNCETAKEVCPAGWHLPSDAEWNILEIAAGMNKSDAYINGWRGYVSTKFLKKGSTEFNALLIGMHGQGYFANFDEQAQFWTSTKYGMPTFTRIFKIGDDRIGRSLLGSAFGCSVRCIKDEK